MSTHKCEVIRVLLEEHPTADLLSIVKVHGYECAVRTEEWKNGDLGVYIPPDSIVPDTEAFKFLDGHTRIRARKIRGRYSQGVLAHAPEGVQEGDDCMEMMGIEHYEPPMPMVSGGDNEKGPEGFFPVYDIEDYNRYAAEVFVPGEEVVATEKIHGCLNAKARISMPDGQRVEIKQLVKEDYRGEILGFDLETRKIVVSRVTQAYDNGLGSEWLKLRLTHCYAGRGSSYGALQCTPEHRVYSVRHNDFVEARTLEVGDVVRMIRSEFRLTPVQEQVLVGKLLGDGYLNIKSSTASLNFGHKKEHEEYVAWTEQALGDICGERQTDLISGYGSMIIRSRSVCSAFVKDLFESWFVTGSKEVPLSAVRRIGPIALAFWYMDDGSLSHKDGQEDRALFATNSFSQESLDNLQKALENFGISSVQYESNGLRLRLNADDAEKLFLLIAPYVPPVMQYKLPERYRGHDGWLPVSANRYKSACVDQEITAIEEVAENRRRYDLETGTHNYFANGILVHNCNARYVWAEDSDLHCRIWAGSRKDWKKRDEKIWWWQAVTQNPWIEEWCRAHPGLVLYGEVFGPTQKMKYGAKQNQMLFCAFDILEYDRWLDHDESREVGNGLVWVPEVYRGVLDDERLRALAEEDSSVPGADHHREGLVVKPITERRAPEVGRVQLKLKSNRYLAKN